MLHISFRTDGGLLSKSGINLAQTPLWQEHSKAFCTMEIQKSVLIQRMNSLSGDVLFLLQGGHAFHCVSRVNFPLPHFISPPQVIRDSDSNLIKNRIHFSTSFREFRERDERNKWIFAYTCLHNQLFTPLSLKLHNTCSSAQGTFFTGVFCTACAHTISLFISYMKHENSCDKLISSWKTMFIPNLKIKLHFWSP